MSPSWLDRLSLWLGPRSVVLDRRDWRGRSTRETAPVVPAAAGDAAWRPAFDAAARLLAGRRGSLRVVVANPFVRYALLPWSEAVLGDRARHELAGALFRHSLGEVAGGLEIALDRAAFGRHGLAAGIDGELADGLRRLARAGRLRLSGIGPALVAECDNARAIPDDGCVALAEPGWLTLLGIAGGELRFVRNHRAADSVSGQAGELLTLLTAENPTVDRKKVLIFANEAWPETLGDWSVERRVPRLGEAAHA